MSISRVVGIVAVALVVARVGLAGGDKGITRAEALQQVTAARAFATVDALASPRYGGRLTGTEGFAAAAALAAGELQRAGLQPPAEYPSYLQPFPVSVGNPDTFSCELLPADAGAAPQKLEAFKECTPFRLSGFGDVSAEVVFVGYGITAPELGRDDYVGRDVKGKIVMALRGAPGDGRDWHAYNSHKARIANARAHEAAAYLFAESGVATVGGEHFSDLPAAGINEDVANRILAERKLKVEELRQVLGQGGTASFATGRRFHLAVSGRPPRPAEGANVIGVLPGRERGECVVIGAHLDHTGDWPALQPGADDNASGAAVVLEMARAAARVHPRPRRSLVFVLFGGEEMGLLGSKHLAAHVPPSLGRIAAVLNFDMVGAGSGMFVLGGENFPSIWEPLSAARDQLYPGLSLQRARSEGEARADHGPFQDAGIPAVSIFSAGGQHHGYHTPDDTIFFVTPKIMEVIGRLSLQAAFTLADAPPAP